MGGSGDDPRGRNTLPVAPPAIPRLDDDEPMSVTPAMPVARRSFTNEGIPKVYDDHEGTETDQTALVAQKAVKTGTHPTLLVIGGALSGKAYRLEKPRTVIGRSSQADIALPDVGVSRIHCVVHHSSSQGTMIEDQRSTNGTVLNGRNIGHPTRLAPGDRIGIGPDAVLQFDLLDDAQHDLSKKMYESATRDPLTKVWNRHYFGERFAAELSYAARHQEALAVILFDIDRFKRVNDDYGHAAGDAVLKAVCVSAEANLRREDILARYGGEEFVILARGLGRTEAAVLAERVRAGVESTPATILGRRIAVTVSLGVAELAELADGGRGAAELLHLADSRLYRAKVGGRNRVVAD